MIASLGLVAGFALNTLAQDTNTDAAAASEVFAAIYAGECDDLGNDPLFVLGQVLPAEEIAAEDQPDVEIVGFQDAETVLIAGTNVEAGIEALFQQGQVQSIVVRDSAETDGSYLACGELGGFVVNGQVAVPLTSSNDEDGDDGNDDSYYAGVAVFGDDSGEQGNLTPVRVYVFDTGFVEPATPTAIVATTVPTEVDVVEEPVVQPTDEPAAEPTVAPPASPTLEPTVAPPASPTLEPTIDPTVDPTVDPTIDPTVDPTSEPTIDPTADPTSEPTTEPTSAPTEESDDDNNDDDDDEE